MSRFVTVGISSCSSSAGRLYNRGVAHRLARCKGAGNILACEVVKSTTAGTRCTIAATDTSTFLRLSRRDTRLTDAGIAKWGAMSYHHRQSGGSQQHRMIGKAHCDPDGSTWMAQEA